MRIREKEEILKAYEDKYSALDNYRAKNLIEEYERYYGKLQHMQTPKEIEIFFEQEIEKNDERYKANAYMEGIEAALSDQYMMVLASYGMIVFFRDHMVDA